MKRFGRHLVLPLTGILLCAGCPSNSVSIDESNSNGAPIAPSDIPAAIGGDSVEVPSGDGTDSDGATAEYPRMASYTPPIGIPAPPFGVREIAPDVPANWSSPVSGFYYVDNTHPASTDQDNPLGSPLRPRDTVPESVPAGSVVEIHGGPYEYTVGGVITVGGIGRADAPIFIRGASGAARPIFRRPVRPAGQYVIVENIDVREWATGANNGVGFNETINHASLRFSEIHGGPRATTSAVGVGGDAGTSNIVLFQNLIHDNGNWQATYDEDHHGVGISSNASYVWVLDNQIYRNSGDGVQINAGNPEKMPSTNHIFVARNQAWENKQSGFWSKFATDVVFSQNTARSHRPSNSSTGAGMGWQYGPERVWFLFNQVYDCEFGITCGSSTGPGGVGVQTNLYLIGNLIHDIRSTTSNETGVWSAGAAISIRDEYGVKHIFNNTIYGADYGITNPRTAPVRMLNNLIAAVDREHIYLDLPSASSASSLGYSLFDGPARIRWNSAMPTRDVASFKRAVTGQGVGCIEADPQLEDPSAGDYRPDPKSPVVGAGTSLQDVLAEYEARYGVSIDFDFANRLHGIQQPASIGALAPPGQ